MEQRTGEGDGDRERKQLIETVSSLGLQSPRGEGEQCASSASASIRMSLFVRVAGLCLLCIARMRRVVDGPEL